MLKQVILVRQDLKLPKGKLAVQVAHASLEAALQAKSLEGWRMGGAKKVVLKVEDEKAIRDYADQARRAKLPTAIIHDAGKTVLEPGTLTAVGIGPADEQAVDKITAHLKCL
ncbi:MAG: peptidyl-tRNA hydrolase Pth2 [Nanoarchaeota archaeon]